jgi:predicted dithiol-disulfide oxidoreductase (DUF899 family)
MNSCSEVIKFPKAAKPIPEAEKPLPWWQNDAEWVLGLAEKHPEVNELLNNRSRLFLYKMRFWRHPPTRGQKDWLMKIADWTGDTMTAIKALEADKSDPSPAA